MMYLKYLEFFRMRELRTAKKKTNFGGEGEKNPNPLNSNLSRAAYLS